MLNYLLRKAFIYLRSQVKDFVNACLKQQIKINDDDNINYDDNNSGSLKKHFLLWLQCLLCSVKDIGIKVHRLFILFDKHSYIFFLRPKIWSYNLQQCFSPSFCGLEQGYATSLPLDITQPLLLGINPKDK